MRTVRNRLEEWQESVLGSWREWELGSALAELVSRARELAVTEGWGQTQLRAPDGIRRQRHSEREMCDAASEAPSS